MRQPWSEVSIDSALRQGRFHRRHNRRWIRNYECFLDLLPAAFPMSEPCGRLPELARSTDDTVGGAALHAMALLGRKAWIPFLEKVVVESPVEGNRAAEVLAEIPGRIPLRILMEHLRGDPRPLVRYACAGALRFWRFRGPKELYQLVGSLLDRMECPVEHPFVREGCAECLGFLLGPIGCGRGYRGLNRKFRRRVSRSLLDALRDPSTPVRFFACYAVGQIGMKEALPILRSMTDDQAYYPNMWTVGEEATLAMSWIYKRPIEDPEPGRGQRPGDWPTWDLAGT